MRSIVEEALSRKRFEDVARDDAPVSAIYDAEAEAELGAKAHAAQAAKIPVPTQPSVQTQAPPAKQEPIKSHVDYSSQYNFSAPKTTPTDEDDEFDEILAGLLTKITVIGCGGGGCNTVARVYEEGVEGADIYALNTDAQHLSMLRGRVGRRILIGRQTTKGLGAGAIPQRGEEAALESEDVIRQALAGSNMVFVTAGLGGGTGTGSAPVVAKIAKEVGA
ncbi:MAG: hypothetical protein M0P20_02730, partial [Methanocorpusculum sp.]|nr:hypothetical protein [Methanocorpusculum sp.]